MICCDSATRSDSLGQREFFDEIYEAPSRFESLDYVSQFFAERYNNYVRELVTDLAARSRGSLILDCGCGDGRLSEVAASVSEGAGVLGVDFSGKALAKARARLSLAGKDVSFLAADVQNLPLREGVCGAAFEINVLHHLPDLRAGGEVIREVRRSLTGQLLVIESLVNNPFWVFLRFIGWKLMPIRVRIALPDLVTSRGKPPNRLLFSACALGSLLISAGMVITSDQRRNLFLFTIYYLCRAVQVATHLFPRPVLESLFKLEIALDHTILRHLANVCAYLSVRDRGDGKPL